MKEHKQEVTVVRAGLEEPTDFMFGVLKAR